MKVEYLNYWVFQSSEKLGFYRVIKRQSVFESRDIDILKNTRLRKDYVKLKLTVVIIVYTSKLVDTVIPLLTEATVFVNTVLVKQ